MHGVALVPSSRLDVVWLDDDFALNLGGFDEETLDEARALPPGALISPPVAVALGEHRLDVFGIVEGGALNHWVYDASAPIETRWSSDVEVVGVGFSSTPAVVASEDRIDLFALGGDLGMLHTAWNGSTWTALERLGGGFTSLPVVLPAAAGAFDIFARGLDFVVYHARWAPGAPADWRRLGGGLLGEPSAASAPAVVRVRNGALVFVTGTDGAIWYVECDGSVWKPWRSLGHAHAHARGADAVTFISEPVAVALYPNSEILAPTGPIAQAGATGPATSPPPALISSRTRVDVFGVGSDSALWQKTLDHAGWRPAKDWAALGGSFACAPSVVAPARPLVIGAAPPARFAMAAPFTDGTVHRWRFDPTPTALAPAGAWSEDQPPRPAFRLPSRYTFAVDSVQIGETRSQHNDTDLAIATLSVGNWPLQSIAFDMEDVDNGAHPLDERLAITRVAELCEPVVFTYSIVNSHDSEEAATVTAIVIKGIDDFVNDLLKESLESIPVFGNVLGAGFGWLADRLVGFAFGGCDGLVAAEAIPYATGSEVQGQLAAHGAGTPRKFATSTRNLRDDFPADCRASSYLVVTSITRS
jgi:hypothetical protein